jgi:UDP-glucose-4-epimerase GalE
MRVLVTGGAGYIGSHVARVLARNGHDVVIYDNLSTGHRFLADGFECLVADIADRGKLALALRGVTAVLHFAAFSDVAESVRNPRKYMANNVASGLALLDSIVGMRIPYCIFSSSASVYGIPEQLPIAETTPRIPTNPYGASKLAFEHALEAYSRAYPFRFVSLRYFNAAGADESGEIGELHQPETHLIPCALAAAGGFRDAIEVYGKDYPTPDGSCIRDYIHVNDLAEAHVLALEYLKNSGESCALNLGSGDGYSVLNVLGTVEMVTGRPLKKRFCSARPGDPPVLVADSRRALELLGWRPSRSLFDIVSTAWGWVRSNPQVRAKCSATPGNPL